MARLVTRRVGKLVVACTEEHDWTRPVDRAVELARMVPAERVVAAVEYHRVVGCVLASLGDSRTVDPKLWAPLATLGRRASGYGLLVTAALRSVRSALGDDLTWLAFKGPVLDGLLYPRPRLRTYRDLDVLVPPDQLRDAVTRLEASGFVVADRNWRLIRERLAGQVHLQREGCAPVDLHWTLVFGRELRETLRFDPSGMIARARTVELADGPVRTFDRVDTLLHLAVHAALEGGDRLVWLKDIDVAVRDEPSWSELVERAERYRVRLPVATMLARTARTLGTPVPGDVIARLAPASWRVLTRAADAAFPPASSRGFGSPATLLARSARGSGIRSIGTATRGIGLRARSLIRGQVRRPDHRADPTHVTSLRHVRGGLSDRDEYFDRVAAGREEGFPGARERE